MSEEINSIEPQEEEVLFEHHRIVVDKGQSLLRIDKFLSDRLANTSRNKIQHAIHNGFIQVNGKAIKPNYKVHPLDVITISLPQPPRSGEIKPENIPLDIVYEDKHLIVLNKKAGMVVHPAYNNWEGTLVNALVYHFQQLPEMQGNEGRPGLVHRLDKDTSGLMVVAKTEEAMMGLARQFFHHTIERTYWALVWGEPKQSKGTINAPLGRNPKDRRMVIVYEGELAAQGRPAITHYEVIKPMYYVSLLRCRLETGRTHQIRAHMKHIGHPIFNDPTYGGDQILKGTLFSKYRAFVENCFKLMPRQALHAQSLGFEHPITKEWMHFESSLPEDFRLVLEKWERYCHAVARGEIDS
ncbi:MAG: RluA family pseudouridine synthase [Cytophagales bacterium]|nr:RluA family pseudouridine synthase [Bernardetiaceae bacterium]MDW8210533.1 RluA family pseudouridine synthase [Cytophagales bacterium]